MFVEKLVRKHYRFRQRNSSVALTLITRQSDRELHDIQILLDDGTAVNQLELDRSTFGLLMDLFTTLSKGKIPKGKLKLRSQPDIISELRILPSLSLEGSEYQKKIRKQPNKVQMSSLMVDEANKTPRTAKDEFIVEKHTTTRHVKKSSGKLFKKKQLDSTLEVEIVDESKSALLSPSNSDSSSASSSVSDLTPDSVSASASTPPILEKDLSLKAPSVSKQIDIPLPPDFEIPEPQESPKKGEILESGLTEAETLDLFNEVAAQMAEEGTSESPLIHSGNTQKIDLKDNTEQTRFISRKKKVVFESEEAEDDFLKQMQQAKAERQKQAEIRKKEAEEQERLRKIEENNRRKLETRLKYRQKIQKRLDYLGKTRKILEKTQGRLQDTQSLLMDRLIALNEHVQTVKSAIFSQLQTMHTDPDCFNPIFEDHPKLKRSDISIGTANPNFPENLKSSSQNLLYHLKALGLRIEDLKNSIPKP